MVCTECCLIGLLDALFADCIYRLVSQYDCLHRWNLDSHTDLILLVLKLRMRSHSSLIFEPWSTLLTLDLGLGQGKSGSLMKSWVFPEHMHKWCCMNLVRCWFPDEKSVRTNTSKQFRILTLCDALFVLCVCVHLCVYKYICAWAYVTCSWRPKVIFAVASQDLSTLI